MPQSSELIRGRKLEHVPPHPGEVFAGVDKLDERERKWLPTHKAAQIDDVRFAPGN